MATIALFGAAGKIGARIAASLRDDPDYDVVHASMVPIHAAFVEALKTDRLPETLGEDNLKTMRLMFAAYELAQWNQVVESG